MWLQLKTRSLRENSSNRLTLILGVIGIVEIFNTGKGHTIGGATVAGSSLRSSWVGDPEPSGR